MHWLLGKQVLSCADITCLKHETDELVEYLSRHMETLRCGQPAGMTNPPCFENGRWEIIAVYFSFGQRSIRRGKVRNIYEILMMFLVHQLLCERSSILSSLLILFFHSYQVLSRQTTKESLTFYPRQSLVNQDALQGNFYFKSAKLTQCWFNFAVSWRRKHVAAMNFFKILIITTLPRSS
jgi:hypothetical protein